jgi:tRNA pseudouridine32 synthase/23S rRNA pseudouridine746 synthase
MLRTPMTPDLPPLTPVPPGLVLLHEDEDLLVLDKPAGLLCQPGRGEDKADSLFSRVLARWPDALVVHRLDLGTSGLMAFARGPRAAATLSAAFRERRVDKAYVAVVHGRPGAEGGEIDLPLAADWPNRPRQKVDPVAGRPCLTRWRRLGPDVLTGGWRVHLEPLTGRSHQLRVHMAALGHPLLGDALYAPPGVREAAPRLLLHAQDLALPHPSDGRRMRWHAPAPF